MGRQIHRSSAILIKNCHMIVLYMITCFGTTFETFTEIEILQGPTTLYGRFRLNETRFGPKKQSSPIYICPKNLDTFFIHWMHRDSVNGHIFFIILRVFPIYCLFLLNHQRQHLDFHVYSQCAIYYPHPYTKRKDILVS